MSASPATVGALWSRGLFLAFAPGKESELNAGQIARMSEVETIAAGLNLDPWTTPTTPEKATAFCGRTIWRSCLE